MSEKCAGCDIYFTEGDNRHLVYGQRPGGKMDFVWGPLCDFCLQLWNKHLEEQGYITEGPIEKVLAIGSGGAIIKGRAAKSTRIKIQ